MKKDSEVIFGEDNCCNHRFSRSEIIITGEYAEQLKLKVIENELDCGVDKHEFIIHIFSIFISLLIIGLFIL